MFTADYKDYCDGYTCLNMLSVCYKDYFEKYMCLQQITVTDTHNFTVIDIYVYSMS